MQQQLYTWSLLGTWPSQPVQKWKHTAADWVLFGEFVKSLKWYEGSEQLISYAELAIAFQFGGFRCSIHSDEHATIRHLIVWIKQAFVQVARSDLCAHPGMHDAHFHHAWGKTMPPGCITGASIHRPPEALRFLVAVSRRISKASLATWEFPLADFKCP